MPAVPVTPTTSTRARSARPLCDVLVVGAGFAGAVVAERLAAAGREVMVIDRRAHIAGTAYDAFDGHGILVHRYGPHVFHTRSPRVFDYLSRFTEWRAYEHRVLAAVDGGLYPLPINRTTINRLYGLSLDAAGMAAFLARVRLPRRPLRTSEDVVLNSVGEELCAKFFRGYTRKRWGVELAQLAACVAARVPPRLDDDDRYFTDAYQAMPRNGYTAMFRNLLDHPRIRVLTGIDYRRLRERLRARLTIYTGPLDEYFGHCHGPLPYRSLAFVHEHHAVERFQATGTVNYPNDQAYSRITEFKHLTGQCVAGTSIVREYARADGEPCYPIPARESARLYRHYAALARRERDVLFVGRLAQYRYYDMDQVVAAALHAARRVSGAAPGHRPHA